MTKWEYERVHTDTESLNEEGAKGWEAVAMSNNPGYSSSILMKRLKPVSLNRNTLNLGKLR